MSRNEGPEIRIRRAVPGDADFLYRLNRDCLGMDYPEKETARRLEQILALPHHTVFVAETGSKVAGYVHMADYDCCYSDPAKDILALAVDPSLQGRGTGRMLMEAVEDQARRDGAAIIRLVSGWDREGAHRFYEACGYENRKDQKNFRKFLYHGN